MATSPIEVVPVEVRVVTREAESILPLTELDLLDLMIDNMVVNSDRDLINAKELLSTIASRKSAWAEYWKPKIDAAYSVHRLLTGACNPVIKRIDAARSKIETKMRVCINRIEAEKRRQEEALRQQAEDERRKLEQAARTALMQGQVAHSKALQASAIQIVAPILPDAVPDMGNVGTSMTWVVTITDKLSVLMAVVDGKLPLEAVSIDEGLLKKLARDRGGLSIPGLTASQKMNFRVSKA